MGNSRETVANVAVTLLCVVVAFTVVDTFIIDKYFRKPPAANPFRVGEDVSSIFKDAGLTSSDVTALYVISSHCTYCVRSAEFYRRIAEMQRRMPSGRLRTVLLAADGEANGRQYAKSHGIAVDAVQTLPSEAWPRFTGTPTLLLIDRKGLVTGNWTGMLDERGEQAVMSVITRCLEGQGAGTDCPAGTCG